MIFRASECLFGGVGPVHKKKPARDCAATARKILNALHCINVWQTRHFAADILSSDVSVF